MKVFLILCLGLLAVQAYSNVDNDTTTEDFDTRSIRLHWKGIFNKVKHAAHTAVNKEKHAAHTAVNKAKTEGQKGIKEIKKIEHHIVPHIHVNPKEVFNKLKTAVQKAVDKAKIICQKSIKEIKIKSAEIIKKGSQDIHTASKKLLHSLKDQKEKAKKTGINVSKCTKQLEHDLLMVPIKLEKGLIACVTNKVKQAERIVEHAVKAAEKTYKQVANLGDQIHNCGSGVHAVNCIVKFVSEITKDITVLPAKISRDISKATKLVKNFKHDMEKCAALNVAKVAIDGGKVMAKITKCVYKLRREELPQTTSNVGAQ